MRNFLFPIDWLQFILSYKNASFIAIFYCVSSLTLPLLSLCEAKLFYSCNLSFEKLFQLKG